MILLKELRKERGMTQTEIAKALKISRQVYANYENEINQPDCKMLIALANYFETSIDYLLGQSDDFGNIEIRNSVSSLSPEKVELLALFDEMTAFEKSLLLTYANGLLKKKAGSNTATLRGSDT